MTPRVTPSDNSSAAPDGWGSAPSRGAAWMDQHQQRKRRERRHPGSWLTQNSAGLWQGRLSASRTSEARSTDAQLLCGSSHQMGFY